MKVFRTLAIATSLVLCALAAFAEPPTEPDKNKSSKENAMQLGNFSVSLAVKDIKVSKDFYEQLGFAKVGGNIDENWLILQNGTTTIGLFQGMFERNALTFNPGWNKDQETLREFDDVRDLQAVLKQRGVKLVTEADSTSTGPASFTLVDPDGNPILVDQHVSKPN